MNRQSALLESGETDGHTEFTHGSVTLDMNDGSRLGRALLWAWAIAATFVGALSSGLALYFFLHREPASPARTAVAASPFLELPDESLPGLYRWIEEGKPDSTVTLFANHSFAGGLGRNPPDHRWVVTRDSLWIIWANKTDKFTNIVSPGVYIGFKDDGTVVRLEKQP